VILLHAFPLDGRMWDGLPGRRLDYPGRGSLADWADAIAAAMPEPDEVCGLSMGGYTAFELVRRHPGRVSRLVLADTRPQPDSDQQRGARDANIAAVREGGAAALWERMGASLLRAEPDPAAAARARALAEAQPPERLVAMLEALRDRADSSDVLEAIAVPVTVIVGAEDAVTPPAATRAWAARIRGARVVEIPGAGHLTALEQPEAFAAATYSSG
jgi:pimeloyl-ACP methyl ester carboxylesterase